MQLYPIRLEPIFREKIWGGRRLASYFDRDLPSDRTYGESWNVVDRESDHISKISNGPHKDKNLKELIQLDQNAVLGEERNLDAFGRFPLMVKFLHAHENLSLQVHPGDEYAQLNENDSGKLEAWYILEADEDARVIRGILPDVNQEEFVEAIRAGQPMDVLNCIDVRPGDVILIPPGIIHSIGGDVLLCEIEQNSDVTYRLHDWNRLGPDGSSRELHLDQAMDVIDFQAMGRTRTRSSEMEGPWKNRELLVRTPVFKLEKIEAEREFTEDHPPESYHLITCISGTGSIDADASDESPVTYRRGDTFLIPARMGDYTLNPDQESTLLKTTPSKQY
jgi:mannose-6-phosphate isomerase